MKINLFIIFIGLIIINLISMLILQYNKYKYESFKNNSQPCNDNLSDIDYLKHMIPHHQVAVDISLLLQKKTKNPYMLHILRKLIWTQNYEIKLMEEMILKLPKKDMSIDNIIMMKKYIKSIGDYTFPNKVGLTNTYCDPHFFDPEEHMKHLLHMDLNDKTYIEHMIPHHQVAVDMSKKLLKNTQNDFMIQLAYRIIHNQQEEIILLNDLLNEKNIKYKSKLLN